MKTFRILHYRSLDSTNNLALTLAKEDASEGTVIVSDYQTKGRGRFDRKWISPRGKNLLFSIVLRPHVKVSRAPLLTILTAEVLVDLLKTQFAFPAKIKRPNDVLINGKKIAGILTESATKKEHIDYLVIGLGLNVNAKQGQCPEEATSILIETGKTVDREAILTDFLRGFKSRYQGWLALTKD